MEQNEDREDPVAVEQDRRESVSDWMGLLALIGVLCLAFVLLVAGGYAVRSLFRAFG
jgi:hypothetical protein